MLAGAWNRIRKAWSALTAGGHEAMSSSYTGGYEAVSTGRRLGMWGTSTHGPTSTLAGSLRIIRDRSRELERNDALVTAGLDTLVANIVGKGITPLWMLPDSLMQHKELLQRWWQSFAQSSDFDGICDFYGQQALAVRTMILSGECFGILRHQSDGSVRLQLLEPDYVDETYTVANAGIRYGIQFDSQGQPIKYIFYKSHPAESTQGMPDRVAIPAAQVIHLYKPVRPGQRRGRPWLTSVLLPIHELAQYNDAELVRKKTAAMFGGFLTRTEFANPYTPPELGEVDNGVIEMEPGTFPELPPGYDVKFSEPADVGGNYDIFNKRQERRIARGFGGLAYHQLTGDLSEVNYSSIRAGNLEFQRQVRQLIEHCVIYRFCQPVLTAALDAAVLAGELDLPDYETQRREYQRIKWTHDGWQWVDPQKDIKAEILAIRAGLKSRAQSISEVGRDIEDVDREILADHLRTDGLILDTNPNQTAQNGAWQSGTMPADNTTTG